MRLGATRARAFYAREVLAKTRLQAVPGREPPHSRGRARPCPALHEPRATWTTVAVRCPHGRRRRAASRRDLRVQARRSAHRYVARSRASEHARVIFRAGRRPSPRMPTPTPAPHPAPPPRRRAPPRLAPRPPPPPPPARRHPRAPAPPRKPRPPPRTPPPPRAAAEPSTRQLRAPGDRQRLPRPQRATAPPTRPAALARASTSPSSAPHTTRQPTYRNLASRRADVATTLRNRRRTGLGHRPAQPSRRDQPTTRPERDGRAHALTATATPPSYTRNERCARAREAARIPRPKSLIETQPLGNSPTRTPPQRPDANARGNEGMHHVARSPARLRPISRTHSPRGLATACPGSSEQK